EQPSALQGAINFAVVNSIGAFMLLTGIALLYGRTGALNLAQIGQVLARGKADGLVVVAFALVTVGFLTKAGAVPFHFWLSDAYAVAPTPVCAPRDTPTSSGGAEVGGICRGRRWSSGSGPSVSPRCRPSGRSLHSRSSRSPPRQSATVGCLRCWRGQPPCRQQRFSARRLACSSEWARAAIRCSRHPRPARRPK